MENLHPVQCGELERLAAAAASMDYSNSLSPQTHNGEESSVSSTQSQMHLISSRSNDSQVVSYVDCYHVQKGSQLVPVRPYDPTQHYYEHPQNVQPLPSRIVMVTGNNAPITNIQFTRASQYVVSNVEQHYQAEENENCDQPLLYSQLVAPANTKTVHCNSLDIENGEINPSTNKTDEIKNVTIVEKGKKMPKRKASNKRPHETDEETNGRTDADKEEDSGSKAPQSEQHSVPKRTGLALELKIEIIKRINSGERKADMAEEYGVNTSTIKSIMKKSDTYLTCWKKGMFNPDSKKLKGPKREDVEEALYSWYKQAIENDTPVSGKILCAKAEDFAKKLGHTDFKSTHGWLDRFKKRKKITFTRSSSKRRDDKMQEPLTSVLPQVLIDYESPQDIFAIDMLGLCYRSLPSDIKALKGVRCAGGVKSKERFSIVLCANMTGSEKFPLLVAGRSQKNISVKNAKALPVHFIVNRFSFLTTEIMSSWLLDMDSWFVQQGRKVILLVPPSPLYSHLPKLRAVKFVALPSGYPSPLHQIAVPCFKKYYRKKILEELILASRGKSTFTTQLPILAYLHLLSTAWQHVSENVIVSSFQRAGLTKYSVWGMIEPSDGADFAGIQEIFLDVSRVLAAPPSPEISFNDFVHFDDDVQVCNLMRDDDILAKVRGIPEEDDYSDDDSGVPQDKTDDEPSFAEVEKALGVLRRYIQYQEGAQEMFKVLGHLEYYIYNASTN